MHTALMIVDGIGLARWAAKKNVKPSRLKSTCPAKAANRYILDWTKNEFSVWVRCPIGFTCCCVNIVASNDRVTSLAETLGKATSTTEQINGSGGISPSH